ncbi:hypothetical protein [Methylobacterium dankookense]|uniref:DNA-binding protein n=1 Tax=Methylobacterium dankookense TaxID=560405 RepID=A0A564G7M0_9HYPH|nr:hypothetical protein [Methylobacterium dankookense]GJD58292.1 hypothetical protein IFDJLNFL_4211 [Methylobacterium dankookense]VUF15928.1 hypothetical protein MTDSW087_05677 [Methylobacterium dankookense]
MQATWMTLPEIAQARRISMEDAQRLVDEANCPKVFRLHGTVYLL